MFVNTPLLMDGTFWLQLATVEEPAFLEMVEWLQVRCKEEPPTPVVFFSPVTTVLYSSLRTNAGIRLALSRWLRTR